MRACVRVCTGVGRSSVHVRTRTPAAGGSAAESRASAIISRNCQFRRLTRCTPRTDRTADVHLIVGRPASARLVRAGGGEFAEVGGGGRCFSEGKECVGVYLTVPLVQRGVNKMKWNSVMSERSG